MPLEEKNFIEEGKEKNYLNFNLVFYGDFEDLPNDMGSPIVL